MCILKGVRLLQGRSLILIFQIAFFSCVTVEKESTALNNQLVEEDILASIVESTISETSSFFIENNEEKFLDSKFQNMENEVTYREQIDKLSQEEIGLVANFE